MTSIYREFFNNIKGLLIPLFANLGVKTIQFGGLERLPTTQEELNKILNLVLVKPVVIDEVFLDAQRRARNNTTVWKIYYFRAWSGSVDDFNFLMLGGEQILDTFNENQIAPFQVIKPDAKYSVRVTLQDVPKILTENEAEIYLMSGGASLNVACIVLEVRIESLIKKI